MVDSEFGLCGPCWRDTPFIGGLTCDVCGTPLPGESDGEVELCDDCMALPRPWQRGRAALMYDGNGRKLTLALKHGDRHDIAHPAARWMLNAAGPILAADMLVAPVPLHWTRMIKRRFNQAALLAHAFARLAGLEYCPDLLVRHRRTTTLKGQGLEQRFAALQESIMPHPRRSGSIAGRHVLLIDDVMTTGATFSACGDACLAANASEVSVLALARVAKGP
ncbi:Predicted amidophosphoribosyltransferases [Thalassovita taeanensis]|uniref:Predicted amidophosphoribosyltransferases n=2 Tax=Thalassovita taeanensis TaxID=657014 RepID=A0A1H9JLP3_9RHOB|nr:Predicted amidophosphoribosyltransferases [Thalassovita taeanensis]